MLRFPENLRLVEKLNDEAASEKVSDTKRALGTTHFDHAFSLGAQAHNVLLYIKAAAADTQRRKQNANFKGRVFYSTVATLFQELRSEHSTACEKQTLSF